jgi:RNA polymerase sigma-70 factor (ECF subfamily)
MARLTDPRRRLNESARFPVSDGAVAWIRAVRAGDADSLGSALQGFRDYLLLIAGEELEPELQSKVAASDLVQETFLGALRDLDQFRGRSAEEWRLWLRGILLHQLANHRRHYLQTGKRVVDRELEIGERQRWDWLAKSESPCATLERREREEALLAALDSLPEHYRQAIVMVHQEQLSFEEVGRRLGVSAEAGRKIHGRALQHLCKELRPLHDPAR